MQFSTSDNHSLSQRTSATCTRTWLPQNANEQLHREFIPAFVVNTTECRKTACVLRVCGRCGLTCGRARWIPTGHILLRVPFEVGTRNLLVDLPYRRGLDGAGHPSGQWRAGEAGGRVAASCRHVEVQPLVPLRRHEGAAHGWTPRQGRAHVRRPYWWRCAPVGHFHDRPLQLQSECVLLEEFYHFLKLRPVGLGFDSKSIHDERVHSACPYDYTMTTRM